MVRVTPVEESPLDVAFGRSDLCRLRASEEAVNGACSSVRRTFAEGGGDVLRSSARETLRAIDDDFVGRRRGRRRPLRSVCMRAAAGKGSLVAWTIGSSRYEGVVSVFRESSTTALPRGGRARLVRLDGDESLSLGCLDGELRLGGARSRELAGCVRGF